MSTRNPRFFSSGCSPKLCLPVCGHVCDCPNLGAVPCTWTCWTSICSCGPTSYVFPGPCRWLSILLFCHTHHSVSCHLLTCWGCSQSHCLFYSQRYYRALVPRRTLKDTTHHQPPRHGGEAHHFVVPRVFLFTFFKNYSEWLFSFVQSPYALPEHLDFS